MIRLVSTLLAGLLLATPAVAPAFAQVPPQLDHLRRADGTQVVPDRFLRSWDPVTVLLDHDAGPAKGGAEDHPGRIATLSPAQPGAWTWLGPRTLQFRPAEPWVPLRRETVAIAGGATTTLVPLLPRPVSTGPAATTNGTTGLDTIGLTFPGPVDVAALRRLLTIELAPQPGVTGSKQTLSAQDFTLRATERQTPADPETYLVTLARPIPDGRVAKLRLRLSDEPGLDDPSFEMTLRSATPFTLTATTCGDGFDDTTQDGVTVCTPQSSAGADSVRRLVLQFSSPPAVPGPVLARDALRFDPPLDDLVLTSAGNDTVRVAGRFQAGTVYRLDIAPGTLKDSAGRALARPATARFSFFAGAPHLIWDASQGLVERLGPQMVPLRGAGYDRADIRIFPIDPLSRDFWPFPRGGLVTQDNHPPPLPGNEPAHYAKPAPIPSADMAARIQALGSPAVSALFDLPIHRGGTDAKFGIDLAPSFARIAGARQPGTYLVGLRTTDGSRRQWMRVQVTDLVLTTAADADRVRFYVTSLATAQPVAGAEIRLDGTMDGRFQTLAHGTTGPDGRWMLTAPLPKGHDGRPAQVRRIMAEKATDTLVLDPAHGPQQYANGAWTQPATPWLGWVARDPAPRRAPPQTLCHVFTERPIYRPEEPVLIAGIIRIWQNGALQTASGPGEVLVTGPNDQEWRLPAPLDDVGGFHVKFNAKTEATGDYGIQYVPKGHPGCGAISVKKEAYRLPTFEVLLNGLAQASLDAPFHVDLLARFYAGGLLSGRPIQWRVTQSPYVWSPPGRDGFVFSSDSRFSGDSTFRSTPVLSRAAKTDPGGSAQITLDPTIEPTAQPRQYLIEATVTGDDDMQVRSTQRVTALPPFVLGVKVPRYLPQVGAIDPMVLALDGSGKAAPGLPMTVRLIHRQWNSVLQASDFAQGDARYETQVIDTTVEERHVVSGTDAIPVHFGVSAAGVYIVELQATDKAGRQQTVRVDLFAAGGTPVTWSRPPSRTITLATDKPSYAPGETATLLIESPFQTARALAIIEEPEGGLRTQWVDVAHGVGRFEVPVRKQQVPRLAVHVLVMRGRLPGAVAPDAPFDQRKPVTLAATEWVRVRPVENRVKVTFDAPAEARPGQAVDLVLHLSDAAGNPVSGEATVWMVDQAVLALAKEQPLDPLPDFIVNRPSRMTARDTRGMAFGILPLTENPGGDEHGDSGLANISVRKNFTPVPFYAPRVMVGADGTARLHVVLPDSLTVFMLRAVAISGPDRFGFGTGQMRIRQPVVAQAVLPRFVRPGDRFTAGLVGRIVEGPGGAGRSMVSVQHLSIDGPAAQDFAWDGTTPAHLRYTLTVPEPETGTTSVRIRLVLQRLSDKVGDAVQMDLPIRPDRAAIHHRALLTTGPGGLDIPAVDVPVRLPSYRRTVTLATDPEAVRLVLGLGALVRFPIGGTEQRVALATGELALLPFTPLIEAAGLQGRVAGDVAAAEAAVKQSTDDNGLAAFWPRTPGSVWLTASAYRMMVAAGRAGLAVDKPTMERMAKVLTASLRSDYPHMQSNAEVFERVAALTALADGGTISADDADELARQAHDMPTGSVAEIATVLARLPKRNEQLLAEVLGVLWSRVNVLSRDGHPVYGGLTDVSVTASILPSEARSLALVVQAVATATPDDGRLGVLRAGLTNLADSQPGGRPGWGSTDATAAALRALAASWQAPATPVQATITLPAIRKPGTLDRAHPLLQASTAQPGAARVDGPAGVAVLSADDYVPQQPGAEATAVQSGFVLTRTWFKVIPGGAPLQRIDPAPDGALHLAVGDVVEEMDDLVTPDPREQVALHLPLAAGMEPLNPALATATAEATPSAGPSVAPDWSNYGDDEVLDVWLRLPSGPVVLRTRMRATIPGTFTLPPATAEMLYRQDVAGSTAGRRVVITR